MEAATASSPDEDRDAQPIATRSGHLLDQENVEGAAGPEHTGTEPDLGGTLTVGARAPGPTTGSSLELDWDLIGGESLEWRTHSHALTSAKANQQSQSQAQSQVQNQSAAVVISAKASVYPPMSTLALGLSPSLLQNATVSLAPAQPQASSTPAQHVFYTSTVASTPNNRNLNNPHTAVSICSLNTALVPEITLTPSPSTNTSSLATSPTNSGLPAYLNTNGNGTTALVANIHSHSRVASGLTVRAERILDFCRGIHICLLQEVWGPGVDILTSGLSLSHSIPTALRSSNIPLIANTVNTLAFYFARTGGLWVAHSRVGDWKDAPAEDDRCAVSPNTRQQNARYPPSKRPMPHLSLPSIPLTVPSLRTFSGSVSVSSRSRNGVRALLLDMSEAWGAGKRLLIFNLQLDSYDVIKRRLQLREATQYIQEVILSLTSLIPLNPNQKDSSATTEPPKLAQRSNSLPQHRRSSSTPQTSFATPARKFQLSNSGGGDEFDMIDEYASAASAAAAVTATRADTPTSPFLPPSPVSPFDFLQDGASSGANIFQPFSQAAPPEHSLPPKLVLHLQAITVQTGLLVTGDFNISGPSPGAGDSPEYALMMGLLGGAGVMEDVFRGVEKGAGQGDTVAGDGRNRLVKAGSVLGRVDYMLLGKKMGVSVAAVSPGALMGSGGTEEAILSFLDLEMVEGSVVGCETGSEMSDHYPLVGWFRPRVPE
ncbi:hypothetical protein BC830DRAFT_1080315 [Chytriomyces sp. MP71]|nr:hypothetical protein BC830DRAFT_1080315 [Chytriomyces sp. MP71]